ncbi:hypothetical protein AB0M57_04560 [Streptomyces sp. NPDC051597]|uniref:hypothetical protein n=1 Tax=Streptomyces sp. NPDC051597 TaxID=3155049 RepID=UPI00343A8DB9
MATLDHDERPAIELHEALRSMSPDSDQAVRLTIRAMNGRLVGEVVLSHADVDRLRLAATCHPESGDDRDDSPEALVIAEAEAVIIAAEMGGVSCSEPQRRRSWRRLFRR